MALQTSVSLTEAARQGKLRKYLNQYLKSCLPQEGDPSKRRERNFPNLAGFCRWMGCGMQALDELKETAPKDADYLEAVMEDEALNAFYRPATIILAYLKKRLGYAENKSAPATQKQQTKICVIFEPPEETEKIEKGEESECTECPPYLETEREEFSSQHQQPNKRPIPTTQQLHHARFHVRQSIRPHTKIIPETSITTRFRYQTSPLPNSLPPRPPP